MDSFVVAYTQPIFEKDSKEIVSPLSKSVETLEEVMNSTNDITYYKGM